MPASRPQPSTATNAAMKRLETATDALDDLRVASELGRHWLGSWPAGDAAPATYEDRVFARLEKVGGTQALRLVSTLGRLTRGATATRCEEFLVDLGSRIGPPEPRDRPVIEFVDAWTSDPDCLADGRALIVALRLDAADVTLFTFVDHTIGRLATRLRVDRGHRVRPDDPRMAALTAADARAQVESALARTALWLPERHPFPGSPADREAREQDAHRGPRYHYPDPWDEPAPPPDRREAITIPYAPPDLLIGQLLLRSLPLGGVDLAPPTLSRATRTQLVDDFLRTTATTPSHAGAARAIVDFSGDEVDGVPSRWSPEIVRRFLLDGAACRAVLRGTCTAGELETTLVSWLRHVGRRSGADPVVDECLAAVDTALPRFREVRVDAFRRLSPEDFYPRYEEEYA